MGDTRRHKLFVRFVNKTFPWAKSALVVGDGKAQIARLLAQRGVRVRVIEAEPRYKGQPDPLITYEKGWFDRDTPVPEDIILGMHPDEATAEIIHAANKTGMPFAVVPCCVVGLDAEGLRNSFSAWRDRLRDLAGDCEEAHLDMKGRNLVLYRRRHVRHSSVDIS